MRFPVCATFKRSTSFVMSLAAVSGVRITPCRTWVTMLRPAFSFGIACCKPAIA